MTPAQIDAIVTEAFRIVMARYPELTTETLTQRRVTMKPGPKKGSKK